MAKNPCAVERNSHHDVDMAITQEIAHQGIREIEMKKLPERPRTRDSVEIIKDDVEWI
jgi:hypothetical protein